LYQIGCIDGKNSQGKRVYSPEGKSTTLGAGSTAGGESGRRTGLYLQNSVIRKLTPIECERLQGLPDNYTEGVSNTQRYKALGNAFNVDVVAHILSFIPK
jgi:DNA (cytosine-5)-methyltransferase 3A